MPGRAAAVTSRRSGGIGEGCVELRETCQVEIGAEGLERGAGGLELTMDLLTSATLRVGLGRL
jgi:hypothetical protein